MVKWLEYFILTKTLLDIWPCLTQFRHHLLTGNMRPHGSVCDLETLKEDMHLWLSISNRKNNAFWDSKEDCKS